MTSDKINGTGNALQPADDVELIERSTVPLGLSYDEYREQLRYDFFYSCAYCTMFETEAHAIRFTIDHYEPQNARQDLRDEYTNLMWACDVCNTMKGDRCPPQSARAAGYRFFRPDEDVRGHHFRSSGIRVEPKTNVGYFTIEAVELNRESLLRLRRIRQQLYDIAPLVDGGVLSLRKFPIDRIPPGIRGRAVAAINRMQRVASKFESDIDGLLRDFARSALIDPDTSPDAEKKTKERLAKLNELQGLFPGRWRAR